MFCGNCGSQLADNSRFCGNCGAVVSGTPAPAQPPQAQGIQGGYPHAPTAGPPPSPHPPSYPPPQQSYAAPPPAYASQPAYTPPQAQPQYGQPQAPPQYPSQPPGYATPAAYPSRQAPPPSYPQPQTAYSRPASVTPGAGPMPPQMHWALVLVLAWVTFGLAGLIWAFKQAGFVKKIDPSSNAVQMLGLSFAGMLLQVLLYVVAMGSRSMTLMAAMGVITMLLNVVILITVLIAVFGMRRSLLNYYNTVEPAGLKLSPIMTFFFSILYFQYHLSRIAKWKQTGSFA